MIVQIDYDPDTRIGHYQASSTDLEANYPTQLSDNIDGGSLMEIIDEVNKVVVGYKSFNGIIWADL